MVIININISIVVIYTRTPSAVRTYADLDRWPESNPHETTKQNVHFFPSPPPLSSPLIMTPKASSSLERKKKRNVFRCGAAPT